MNGCFKKRTEKIKKTEKPRNGSWCQKTTLTDNAWTKNGGERGLINMRV